MLFHEIRFSSSVDLARALLCIRSMSAPQIPRASLSSLRRHTKSGADTLDIDGRACVRGRDIGGRALRRLMGV